MGSTQPLPLFLRTTAWEGEAAFACTGAFPSRTTTALNDEVMRRHRGGAYNFGNKGSFGATA